MIDPEEPYSFVPDGDSESEEVRGVTYFPESNPSLGCGARAGVESKGQRSCSIFPDSLTLRPFHVSSHDMTG